MDQLKVTLQVKEMSPLMKWFSTIDILKHVSESDISEMFKDGVLLFYLLRELFEEEIEDPDELAEKILPCENFVERLFNWKVINDSILEQLQIGRSNWFLEYVAKGNKEYIEDVLNSVREIAPEKPRKAYLHDDIVTNLPEPSTANVSAKQASSNWCPPRSYYFDEIDHIADSHDYVPSPAPVYASNVFQRVQPNRMSFRDYPDYNPNARSNYPAQSNQHNHQRRFAPNPTQNRAPRNTDFRHYRNGTFQPRFKWDNYPRTSDRYYNYDRRSFSGPTQSQTYCFFQRQQKRKDTKKRWLMTKRHDEEKPSEDVEERFQQLLVKYSAKPFVWDRARASRSSGYNSTFQGSRYLHRYYSQYESGCESCLPVVDNESEQRMES